MNRIPARLAWLSALAAGCALPPGGGTARGHAADPLAGLAAEAEAGAPAAEAPEAEPASAGFAACADDACSHEDCAEESCAARAWLEEQGLSIEISVTADAATVVGGGVRQRSTTQALFDIGLFADLDTLAGWEGASIWAEWYTRPGRNLYDDVGDWQGTTWIDVPHGHELYQLWLETWLRPDGLRLKLGKQEGFDEFAVVEAAGEFLNNGPAYSPTLELLPTYPDSAFGAALFGYPSEDAWLSAGVFDGAAAQGENTGKQGAGTLFGDPSDLFLIAEAGRSWLRGETTGAGRGLLGVYKHTGNLARFDGGLQDDAWGWYAVFEQELWPENPEDAEDAQGLVAFAQIAAADDDVISVAAHQAAGLAWTGPFEGRDEDILGLAVSRVVFSDEAAAGFDDHAETVIETFYRWQALSWLAIKPDLQLVRDPAGDSAIEDAFVATLRFEAAF